jgi:hypothetical protein
VPSPLSPGVAALRHLAPGLTAAIVVGFGTFAAQTPPAAPGPVWAESTPNAFAHYRAFQQAYPADVVDRRLSRLGLTAAGAYDAVRALGAPRSRLPWTTLGPVTVYPLPATTPNQTRNLTGRVTAMAIGHRCVPQLCRLWAGTAGGGLWRTDRGLATGSDLRWKRLSDRLGTAAIGSIEVDPNDTRSTTLYVGTGETNFTMTSAAGTGLFRSRDAGDTWTRIATFVSDPAVSATPIDFTETRGISRVLVQRGDPDTIYVGTTTAMLGMTAVRGGQSVLTGLPQARVGLYRTTDGGRTWALVWVPPEGPVWTPSPDISPGTVEVMSGVKDIALDPEDAQTVYATAFISGLYRSSPRLENGSAEFRPVFVPTGGGGFDDLVMFALTRANDRTRIYTGNGVPSLNAQAIYRLDDADVPSSALVQTNTQTGDLVNSSRWRNLTSNDIAQPGFSSRGYCNAQCRYDQVIAVPPDDPDTVYAGGQVRPILGDSVIRSDDAGVSFTSFGYGADDPISEVHADVHAIVFSPDDPDIVFVGSDGGVTRTDGHFADLSGVCGPGGFGFATGSGTHAFCERSMSRVPARIHFLNEGLQAIQFYNVAVDPNDPLRRFIGGAQDNGTLWFDGRGPDPKVWSILLGAGDGTSASGFHPRDPNILFASFQSTSFFTHFRGGDDPTFWTVTHRPIQQSNERGSVSALFTGRQFISMDPVNVDTQFTGFEHVWRTQNNGGDRTFLETSCRRNGPVAQTCGDWKPLGVVHPFQAGTSPESPSRQPGNLTGPVYGVDRQRGLVVAAERTEADSGTLWAATSMGRVFIARNADAPNAASVAFTRLDSLSTAAPNRFVSGIAVDRRNANRAFISYSGFNAITPGTPGHVFEVVFDPDTGGATWTPRDFNLTDLPINHIVHDSETGALFAATDFGVLTLPGGGTQWREAAPGFPPVLTLQLRMFPDRRLLFAGTHGLGIWYLTVPAKKR